MNDHAARTEEARRGAVVIMRRWYQAAAHLAKSGGSIAPVLEAEPDALDAWGRCEVFRRQCEFDLELIAHRGDLERLGRLDEWTFPVAPIGVGRGAGAGSDSQRRAGGLVELPLEAAKRGGLAAVEGVGVAA